MSRNLALVVTAVVGGLIAPQAPLNSFLGKAVGNFQAAVVNFFIGGIFLTAIAMLAAGGFGEIGQTRTVPWYYLLGGLLGAAYVTCVLVSVRTLGAGGVVAATVAGQLIVSALIDRAGVLGLERVGLTPLRLTGFALLALGTAFVTAR